MGRQKKVIEKDWESRAQAQYDLSMKKSDMINGYIDENLNSDNEYEEIEFMEELDEKQAGHKHAKDGAKEKKASARRIINKPATQPYIKAINGESKLCFTYPTKQSDAESAKGIEEIEFSIKFDIENVDTEKMTEKFRMDNSIYPRANVAQEKYLGNRWEYETEVNKLAWKLAALNPSLLYGKKGIVQRAVDSFRNLHRSTSSRRVVRMKKMNEGTLRKRQPENSPSTVSLTWTQKGVTKKCKIRVDIDIIDYEKIDSDFKIKYSVFSGDFDDQSFGLGKWENMNEDNFLAVKIAFLNMENTSFWNAVKATDKVTMLKKAVEVYKAKKAYEESKQGEEAASSSLPDAEQEEREEREEMYFMDQADVNFKERSFYYYL
ncbi:hypothetical protein NECID01_0276 [Nematocida sp. AWRm77]|nr:hypothetical protein NECID01_0276 [Nematocida sp. AWRm77]